jgi:hypothetical protein
LQRAIDLNPNHALSHLRLGTIMLFAGRTDEAKRSAEMAMKLHPFFEVDPSFSLLRNPEDRKKILEGLRKAGLK